MLAKELNKKGYDWDELLESVLMAYHTTPHSSTGEAPFYLVYGRDARLPTALNFNAPAVHYTTIATEYAKELAVRLKRARATAKDNIQRSQRDQKKYYDRNSKEFDLQVGNLVLLKVQPHFKLDSSYKESFTVQSLTSMNTVIKLVGDKSAEPWNISRQRLSKCHPGMEQVIELWVGYTNKLR